MLAVGFERVRIEERLAVERQPVGGAVAGEEALREYQDEVVKLWRTSLNGWPFFLPSMSPEETDETMRLIPELTAGRTVILVDDEVVRGFNKPALKSLLGI